MMEKTVGRVEDPLLGVIEIVKLPSIQEIEGLVAEMITSAPVGAVEADDVIKNLEFMRVVKPEQYREIIERLIAADRGETNE